MNRSLLVWIAIPVAVALGAVGGVVAMQRMKARPPLVPLVLANPADAPPVAVPRKYDMAEDLPPSMPVGGRSPFDVPPSDPKMPQRPDSAKESEPGNDPVPAAEPDMVYHPEEFTPPPGYFDLPAPNKGDGTDPPIIKVGQVLNVEVLEALPGRPITGVRVVRPDGTISLGFYGDLRVAGLNRYQAKVKLIEHLMKSLTQEVLGFWRIDPATGKFVVVPPVESGRVFIDESANYFPGGADNATQPTTKAGVFDDSPATKAELDRLRIEINKLRKELEEIREEHKSPRTDPPVAASKPG